MKLPKYITVGPITVELICVPHELMYDVADAQGSFVFKPPVKIHLDESIIELGGPDAVNVVLHELLHLGYYQYSLKDREEEPIINGLANFLTEILCYSEIKDWIKYNTAK